MTTDKREASKTVEELDHVFTDLMMLAEGEWDGDEKSTWDTIEMLTNAAKKLGIDLRDLRGQ